MEQRAKDKALCKRAKLSIWHRSWECPFTSSLVLFLKHCSHFSATHHSLRLLTLQLPSHSPTSSTAFPPVLGMGEERRLKGVLWLLVGMGALLLFPVTTCISWGGLASDPAKHTLRQDWELQGKGPSVASIRAALSRWGTVRSRRGWWWRGGLRGHDREGPGGLGL